MSHRPVVCLYHKQCVDGTVAAAVVLKKYPETQMFPISFDTANVDLDIVRSHIVTESLIIYVDNSIGLPELAQLGNEILVIDHHVSEQERVEDIAASNTKVTVVYDVEESGASLAWKYFFPSVPVPSLISYVRDIDIWKNEMLPESEWMHLALSAYRDQPGEMASRIDEEASDLLSRGKVIAEHISHEVTKTLTREPVVLQIGEYTVPAYNITNHQSKAGHLLSEINNSVVMLYTISGDRLRCSFRSIEGQIPSALMIATSMGGGGHEHSAGASMSFLEFVSYQRK